MGHKTKRITRRDRRRFVLFWTLGCVLIFTLIFILVHRISITFTPLDSHLVAFIERGAIFMAFACLQRSLIRRYLHIDMRHWLRWTCIGFIAGHVCHYSVFTAAAYPFPAWLQLQYGGDPSQFADLLNTAYHSLRLFFLFGFPMLFQGFALPKTFSFRWIWLLTAFIMWPLILVTEDGGLFINLVKVTEALLNVERIDFLRVVLLLDWLTPFAIPGMVLAWLATLADRRRHLAGSSR